MTTTSITWLIAGSMSNYVTSTTTSRSLIKPISRRPSTKTPKSARVWKHSELAIQIKEAKVKYRSLLTEPLIVVVSSPSTKTEPSQSNVTWIAKTLLVIKSKSWPSTMVSRPKRPPPLWPSSSRTSTIMLLVSSRYFKLRPTFSLYWIDEWTYQT